MIRSLPITPELAAYIREAKQAQDAAVSQMALVFTVAVRSHGLMVADFVRIGGTDTAPVLDVIVPDETPA